MPVFNRPLFWQRLTKHRAALELHRTAAVTHLPLWWLDDGGGTTKSHNLSVALRVNNVLMKNEAAWQEVKEASGRGTPHLQQGRGIIWTDRGTFCLFMHVEKWYVRPQDGKKSLWFDCAEMKSELNAYLWLWSTWFWRYSHPVLWVHVTGLRFKGRSRSVEHPRRAYIVSLLHTFCKKHQVGLQRGERGTDGREQARGRRKAKTRENGENIGLIWISIIYSIYSPFYKQKCKANTTEQLGKLFDAHRHANTAKIIYLCARATAKTYFMDLTAVFFFSRRSMLVVYTWIMKNTTKGKINDTYN